MGEVVAKQWLDHQKCSDKEYMSSLICELFEHWAQPAHHTDHSTPSNEYVNTVLTWVQVSLPSLQ